MASSEKSERLGLSLWEASDRPERLDFRQDNEKLEELVGGHIANVNLHMTAGEREYLKLPYGYEVYKGTGKSERWAYPKISITRAQAVFVMCCTKPPVLVDAEGITHIYWDVWAPQASGLPGQMTQGGIRNDSGCWVVKSGASGSKYFHLNDADTLYMAIFLPKLG